MLKSFVTMVILTSFVTNGFIENSAIYWVETS